MPEPLTFNEVFHRIKAMLAEEEWFLVEVEAWHIKGVEDLIWRAKGARLRPPVEGASGAELLAKVSTCLQSMEARRRDVIFEGDGDFDEDGGGLGERPLAPRLKGRLEP